MKTIRMAGCGNKFILFDEIKGPPIEDRKKFANEESANAKLGNYINDGFLFVLPPRDNETAAMEYYDIDRNTGEPLRVDMCGNGIRCVGRYVHDAYGVDKMIILTDDGPKNLFVDKDGLVRVNMGPPREFQHIDDEIYFVNTSLAHVVYLLEKFDIDDPAYIDEARERGREVSFNESLMKRLVHPEGLHVNSVKISGQQRIEIATYEPGVADLTLACGTGATASAYVSAEARKLNYPISVRNRGGDLFVDKKQDDLYLIGPVNYYN